MTKEDKKLQEAELVDEQVMPTPAVEAKPEDVVEPAVEVPEEVAAPVEDSVEEPEEDKKLIAAELEVKDDKVEIEIPKDSLEDVAEMIANKTAAEEIMNTEDPEVADAEASTVEDAVVQSAVPEEPAPITESLSEEDRALLAEFREWKKMREADEHSDAKDLGKILAAEEKNDESYGGPDITKIEPAPIEESCMKESEEDICPICGKAPCECESMDPMAANDVDAISDSEYNNEAAAALDDLLQNVEDDAIEAVTGIKDTADQLQDTADFLKKLFIDAEEEPVEDFDMLAALDEPADVDMDAEDIPEEDLEESIERIPVALPKKPMMKDEVKEDKIKLIPRTMMQEKIIYPAGSQPQEDDDLVKAYEAKAAQRRKALADFREAMKASKVESEEVNTKFNEAIKGSYKLTEEVVSEGKTWAENKFLDKYQENQQLDFKKLLENGFLG